jgi:hypothetical protein
MKQTAVEWLIGQIEGYESDCEIFQIAEEMEKKRMIDFAKYCLNNAKYLNFEKALFNVEEYYEIFKSK